MKMVEAYYKILIHNPEGKLVKDTGLIPSRSYVIQFLEMIQGFFDRIQKVATDVDNAENQIIAVGVVSTGRTDALALDDLYGIVVGTNAGETAEDNEDYKLDTKIAHSGDGTLGTLNYRSISYVAPRTVGANIDFDITRTFLNETAATITIKEIGLICKSGTKYFLLLRDVVTPEEVLAGYTLTVVYVLRTTA